MSSLPELELSQLPGSSVGEGVERRHQEEEDLGSPAAAAAAPLVPAPDTADMSAPELGLGLLAGSSVGEGVERQEDSPAAAAAAAAAAVPATETAERSSPRLRQLAESELQEVHSERLEADVIFMPVENNLFTRLFVIPTPMVTRYVYTVLFTMLTIVAWIMRDIELSRFDHYACDGSDSCITADGVLRASMALAVSLFEF
jgi:hypothetical protein